MAGALTLLAATAELARIGYRERAIRVRRSASPVVRAIQRWAHSGWHFLYRMGQVFTCEKPLLTPMSSGSTGHQRPTGHSANLSATPTTFMVAAIIPILVS